MALLLPILPVYKTPYYRTSVMPASHRIVNMEFQCFSSMKYNIFQYIMW